MSRLNQHLTEPVKVKKGAKIGIAVSRYNFDISGALLESCVDELVANGILKKNIEVTYVPGAFELPLACTRLAERQSFDAIIALGTIIKGETPHFDFIAFAATQGIMNTSLSYKLPVVFGVLTTTSLKQAQARIQGGKRGDKGVEAARSALHMIQ